MAITNRDSVSRGLETLKEGLFPFVERQLKAHLGANWLQRVEEARRSPLTRALDSRPS